MTKRMTTKQRDREDERNAAILNLTVDQYRSPMEVKDGYIVRNAAPVPSEQVGCEFEHPHPHEWYCTVHQVTKIAGTTEPVTCDWSGSPDPCDPDNYWIDDETGERVSAITGERTQHSCAPSKQEVTPELVVTYCGKCGVMVNYQQNYCDACTPKLPRWMRDKQWSSVRYSNNPDDKRWCIQPTTSLRPLFFADVPDATTVKQSHDIGRYVAEAANSHAELKERVRMLEEIVRDLLPEHDLEDETCRFCGADYTGTEPPITDGLCPSEYCASYIARAALSKGEK